MNPDIKSLAEQLGKALLDRGWRATCAESCTGGGVAYAITEVAGSSQWFDAGFVTYSNAMKQRVLGVTADSLERCGAVSDAVVREMATGALKAAGADMAVSVSGIAGPDGGSADKPVGTVWFAWAAPEQLLTACHRFPGDRQSVREQAVAQALRGLLELVK